MDESVFWPELLISFLQFRIRVDTDAALVPKIKIVCVGYILRMPAANINISSRLLVLDELHQLDIIPGLRKADVVPSVYKFL
jgi:hypothetical protein